MLIKGLPKINRIRKFTIPGKIGKKEYSALQKGKEVEVLDDVAKYLVENEYAVSVSAAVPKGVKKDG